MLCGVIGNVLVLLVYRRDKKQSGAVYIITFAVLDLIACVVILPQYPMYELAETYEYHLADPEWLKAEGRLLWLAYVFVQVTMALDQFLAVFYPFKHMKLRSALNRAMLALFAGFLALFCLMRYVLPVLVLNQHFYVLAFAFLSGMITLLSVYPAVALKLYRQGRIKRPSNSRISAVIELQTAASAGTRDVAGTGTRGVAGTGTRGAAGTGTRGATTAPTSRTAEVASQATATQPLVVSCCRTSLTTTT